MENQLVKRFILVVVVIFLFILINPFSCGDSNTGKGLSPVSKILTISSLQKNISDLQKSIDKKIDAVEMKFNLRLIQYFIVFMVLSLIGLAWTAHYYKKLLLGKKSVKKVVRKSATKAKKAPAKKKVSAKKSDTKE